MTRARWPVLLLAGLALIAYYAWIAWQAPFNVGDEGYLYYLSWAMSLGQSPYRDFELSSYPPGLFALHGLVFRLFGASIESGRGFDALWLLANVGLAHGAVRGIAGRGPAWVATALVALIPGPWHLSYIATLSLASLWLGVRIQCDGRRWDHVWLGGVIGLGLQMRLDAAICAMALALLVSWRRAPATRLAGDLSALLGTALLTLLPLSIYLQQRGLFGDYLAQLGHFVGIASERSGAWYRLPPPGFDALFSGWPGALFPALYFSSFAIVLGVCAVAGKQMRSWQWQDRAPLPLGVLVACWVLMNFPQHALERPDEWHLYQRGFAFVVGACCLLGQAPLRALFVHRTARTIHAVAAFCLLLFTIGGLWFPAGGGPGNLRGAGAVVVLPNGLRFVEPMDSDWGRAATDIVAETRPQDRIAGVPFAPGLNFITQRLTPGRRNHYMPNAIRTPNDDAQSAAMLARASHVALQPGFQFSPMPRAALGCYAPAISFVLNHDYDVRQGFAHPLLLARRPGTSDVAHNIVPPCTAPVAEPTPLPDPA
ncbi:glycosyltransferase family 39 protein [Arenimonas oryziterrae]|uniref:Glycosyltransferase RgtA/B/C/D-like domain-containing protein n=1 Tax=Arenimonas oryziterrae DSM 21050 = YC6267 TaxID=1121015 RepID=A0A091B177_9GAMM|nr:glycosyltransferase family 39 protein [Arenimonas oryziterrae]KFN44634.1 hypothetical protein N789_01090 [Arenimonas oryziterrae DSM 21050 = YC6267]